RGRSRTTRCRATSASSSSFRSRRRGRRRSSRCERRRSPSWGYATRRRLEGRRERRLATQRGDPNARQNARERSIGLTFELSGDSRLTNDNLAYLDDRSLVRVVWNVSQDLLPVRTHSCLERLDRVA